MKIDWPRTLRAVTLVLLAMLATGSQVAGAQGTAATKLRIVGGLGSLNQYTRHEEPFWAKDLAKLSNGRFSAEIVPFDRAGVPGEDMLRLMQLGVVPFGTAQLSRISTQDAEFSAPDLAGLNPDMPALKRNLASFRPYLEKTLRERYGIELLAVYAYPAQVLFCKKPLTGLTDLSGRRIRVSGTTAADFIEAFGGVPVITSLTDILPNLASGNIECAITGTMSGNTIGLHEVTSHIHSMTVTWGLSIFAANASAWDSLPADLKTLLRKEIPKLESAIWSESERETAEGIACNTGATSCSNGRKGTMMEIKPSADDERRRKEVFAAKVLPRWVQRCGTACTAMWNQTLGVSAGIKANTR
jgi:TRAP-type C4-dicarboxylate transport system substrate-binding protein